MTIAIFRFRTVFIFLALSIAPLYGFCSDLKTSGKVSAEARGFVNDPMDPIQHGNNLSLAAEVEWSVELNDGQDILTLVPFVRLDQGDDERTHLDLREAIWTRAGDSWEVRVGVGKVFWGVTESQHLVDIVNQTDLVEDPDGEDKLGQPMISLSLIRSWGTLDLYALPGFRERTFPGREGRLRSQPRVDVDNPLYESAAEQTHIDWVMRWSHSMGGWDVGISYFKGTSRDPRFILDSRDPTDVVLDPLYEQIEQVGIDAQLTHGAWLWKLEAIRRSGQGETYVAGTAGVEYTFYTILDSSIDVGVLAEYLYEDRPPELSSPFEDDVFAGLRFSFNDAQSTELLIGCIFDLNNDARFCSVEGSRRLHDHWKLSLEARSFGSIPESNPLFALREDDYVQLELGYYF